MILHPMNSCHLLELEIGGTRRWETQKKWHMERRRNGFGRKRNVQNVYGELWQVSAFFLTYIYLLNKGRQPKGLLGKKWRPWGLLILQNSEAVQRDLYGQGLASPTLLVLSIRCSLLRDFLSSISLLGGGHRILVFLMQLLEVERGKSQEFLCSHTKNQTGNKWVICLLITSARHKQTSNPLSTGLDSISIQPTRSCISAHPSSLLGDRNWELSPWLFLLVSPHSLQPCT